MRQKVFPHPIVGAPSASYSPSSLSAGWKTQTCLSCLSSTMIIILTMMTKTILSLMIIITMMTLVTTTQRKQRGNVRTAKENSVEILK